MGIEKGLKEQIKGGLMTQEESGTVDLSGLYTPPYKVLDMISEGATNVIPLITAHPSEMACAWTVAATRYFKKGHIPQIYMLWEIKPKTSKEVISSNLKDTGNQLKGHFSVTSRNSVSSKALVLGLSLNQATN